MGKITSLRTGKSRKKRISLFLNGKFAASLKAEVAIRAGLKEGQELSADHLEALKSADCHQRCLDAANRYLSYRPRSESELSEQLARRGFDRESINMVLARLKESGLVDDTAFARFWQENRTTFRPRSKLLTRLELKHKGVDDKVIEQVVANVDDDDNAYRAAQVRAGRLPATDYSLFRRRLGEFLRRRGFSYEVINHVVAQLWQEKTGSSR